MNEQEREEIGEKSEAPNSLYIWNIPFLLSTALSQSNNHHELQIELVGERKTISGTLGAPKSND